MNYLNQILSPFCHWAMGGRELVVPGTNNRVTIQFCYFKYRVTNFSEKSEKLTKKNIFKNF